MRLSIGTRSVLFGAHCFLLHPWFVAWGWLRVFGFRRVWIGRRPIVDYVEENSGRRWPVIVYRDEFASIFRPALWIAFIVHDIGYLGKPNMDGEEGEQHPRTGAAIMRFLFGEPWGKFVLYHSRFLAKRDGATPSPLCIADKWAIVAEPWWLYLPRVNLTGEIAEYMAKSSKMNNTGSKYSGMNLNVSSQRAWHADMVAYIRRWVAEHKDGREDTWTPATKDAITPTGVWR